MATCTPIQYIKLGKYLASSLPANAIYSRVYIIKIVAFRCETSRVGLFGFSKM